ncbi:MAG: hypothetical protein K8I60_18785 [Anaerolineae bacterium]|nr:hypothetical protein [Anaerolineae bacterium]
MGFVGEDGHGTPCPYNTSVVGAAQRGRPGERTLALPYTRAGFIPFRAIFCTASLWLMVVLVSLILAACVPAQTPPQLAYTPGPAVIVTDRVYESAAFTVRYPSGWRVVTGAADAPLSVVFVAPDEVSTIRVQVGGLENASLSDAGFRYDVRGVELADGTTITAIAHIAEDRWETIQPIFEDMVKSIKREK